MALVRLPGGGWIEACGVSSVMAQPHEHGLWLVAVMFRDGVTQRLVADEPMDHEKANELADEVAEIVQKSNDDLYLKRHLATKEDTEKAMTFLGWAAGVAKARESDVQPE